MNIYEEDKYPWLIQEKEFIKKNISEGKKVLGICLGAQLIADTLGAKVYKNQYKEIGWFPIKLQKNKIFKGLPEIVNVLHWHGDTFELPKGAELLASSEACINQGFIYNQKVIGLQFHFEMSAPSVKVLLKNCKDELVKGKFIQTEDYLLSQPENFKNSEKYLYNFLNNLENEV